MRRAAGSKAATRSKICRRRKSRKGSSSLACCSHAISFSTASRIVSYATAQASRSFGSTSFKSTGCPKLKYKRSPIPGLDCVANEVGGAMKGKLIPASKDSETGISPPDFGWLRAMKGNSSSACFRSSRELASTRILSSAPTPPKGTTTALKRAATRTKSVLLGQKSLYSSPGPCNASRMPPGNRSIISPCWRSLKMFRGETGTAPNV
mmetsp:Transcript_57759/g.108230  ORF Transcript_57759/g.108230 Transcript_57759/m.108230 type:complete len:208 (+) Transcript_57759:294-917(+)